MLAGYLPFDDDPANPEGDNINLLYKYIVSTPLTFPEYVTPHARDLLKRILVPDPRKRADLFEVARHSWLSDYAHVVSFITSSTTTSADVQKSTGFSRKCLPIFVLDFLLTDLQEDAFDVPPALARSASVREPGKAHTAVSPVHGGLTQKREQINQQQSEKSKKDRDNKRRTVQVEYVAPQSQTVRGEASPPTATAGTSKSRVKEPGPTEVPPTDGYNARPGRPTAVNAMAPPSRPGREPQRSVSDYTAFGTIPATSTNRPSTGGTLGPRLPSRGNSYSQPSTATVAQTNVEGRFSQPKGKQYHISAPMAQAESGMGEPSIGQPSTQRMQSIQAESQGTKGHRRSNTVSETLGRVTSMFSSRQPSYSQDPKESSTSQNSTYQHEKKAQKSYPPTSMPGPIANDDGRRQSNESSRRTSFGFSRKTTDQSGNSGKSSRRFSLLPSSLSKTFSSSHRESMPATSHSDRRGSAATSRQRAGSRPGMAFGRGAESRSPSQSTTGSNVPGFYDGQHESSSRIRPGPSSAPANQTQFDYAPPIGDEKFPGPKEPHPSMQNRPYRHHTNDSEASEPVVPVQSHRAPHESHESHRKGVLQKSRKFADAYEESGGNKGSSGSSKRVMDFFRRMGRQRGREER